MDESILQSVKKSLGIDPSHEFFDSDLIMHINSVFAILLQLGVGPQDGFSIADETSTWQDFLSDNNKLNNVKTYVGLKVKLIFDPPLSSANIESINRLISELEWRINVAAEENQNDGG